jgi:hypothetical protein
MNHRNPDLLKSANGAPCSNCDISTGTEVWAHYTGPRQHLCGKGRAIKGHDAIGAILCRECHEYFDQRKNPDKWLASEEMLWCVAKTYLYLIDSGILSIKKGA